MRALFLTAAMAAALCATAMTPGRADAQVFVYPTFTGSPYAYGNYWAPSYNYAYAWSNPYYTTYSSAWSSPYNYGTWNWVTPNYYSGLRYGYGMPYAYRLPSYYRRW
jgi:hypothetical protein